MRFPTRPGAVRLALALAVAVLATGIHIPTARAADSGSDPTDRPRLFLDCVACDHALYQTEIPFATFVRDPAGADLHVLLTTIGTGAGGTEHTLTLIGRGPFAGMGDTLRFVTPPGESDQRTDARGVRLLRLGLARYIARSPGAGRFDVTERAASAADGGGVPARDPWRGWVFNLDLTGWLYGQSGRRDIQASGAFTADRITTRDKLGIGVDASYSENRYDYPSFSYFSASRYRGANARWVHALGDHWSGALRVWAWSSTYSNMDLRVIGGPAIECNLFPYSASTRRQLRLSYALHPAWNDYTQMTVFFRTEERTLQHELELTLSSREPWGTSSLGVEASNYFHDVERNRVELNGKVSLRVATGLSLNLSGYATRIRDQLSLAATGATAEEILLQRKQLQTDYTYTTSLGLTYTFGSIFNQAVNARFGD